MRRALPLAVLLLLLVGGGLAAKEFFMLRGVQGVSTPTFTVVLTPTTANVACATPAGTLISTATTSGGTGAPIAFSMTGNTTDFVIDAISGAITVTGGGIASPDCAMTFNNTVTATQPASSGAQTIVGINPELVTPNGFVFIAQAGNAGTVLGAVTAILWPASTVFPGTYSISGADAASFSINPSTGVLSLAGDQTAQRNYSINVVAMGSVTGSPYTKAFTITGQAPGTPILTVDNYNPLPGSTINVTVQNSPNTQGTDYVLLEFPRTYRSGGGGDSQYVSPTNIIGVHNAVVPIHIPNALSDNYTYVNVRLEANNSFSPLADSPAITIKPSTAWVSPSGTNSLAAPWAPAQTLTVCPVGCQFSLPSAAIAAAASTDFTKITIKAGAYADCAVISAPTHLWLQGFGGEFAAMGWTLPCSSKGTIVYNLFTAGSQLIIDNMALGDVAQGGSGNAAAVWVSGGGDLQLRNDYLHDSSMGLLTQNSTPNTFEITNTMFTRNGGVDGPSHNIYIGGGGVSLTMQNSISRQATNGYEVKTRAALNTLTCNMLIGDQDGYYNDSALIDDSDSGEDHIHNNLLIKGPGTLNRHFFGFGLETGGPSGVGYPTRFIDMDHNIIINDDPDHSAPHFSWYWYMADNQLPSPPYTTTNNIWVGDPTANAFDFHNVLGVTPDWTEDLIQGGTDQVFASRAAAGLTQPFPIPAACTQKIGNVSVP